MLNHRCGCSLARCSRKRQSTSALILGQTLVYWFEEGAKS
ncbi:hypothetical protein NBRC111894_2799 [Sporolactobacillus inulinus]|uniref:Uncharacterized protein n=1 Tax=Sporolactobacillus inulinus TaxID=2078 RepID=A0A4Y1ZDU3_9BACL|nr:hypothetical protein NBRC111894_2799 [Sporolactobacillus inulinus]